MKHFFLLLVLLSSLNSCCAQALDKTAQSPVKASTPNWKILVPKPNEKVRGEDFSILLGSTSRRAFFKLFIDGEEYFGDRFYVQEEPDPSYDPAFSEIFEIVISTTGLLNGPHIFEARALDGMRQSVKVNVDNFITAEHVDDFFYPMSPLSRADDTHPATCEVRARLLGLARWTVTFLDSNRIIRKFEGKSDRIKAIWDGKSSKGKMMPRGSYECEVTAYAPNGARRQTMHFVINLLER